MTIEAIQWALRTVAPSAADKLVLVCMAQHADERAECWPTMTKLMHDTQLPERAVQESIDRLRASNLITDRPGTINRQKRIFTLALRPQNHPSEPT